MDSYKRLFSVLLLIAFTHAAFATSLGLGAAHRTRIDDKHLYSIPISASIDGYSTFRAVLASADADFLDQTTSKIVKTKTGAVLRVFTPLHLNDVVLAVRIDYQGRSTSKRYRLQADSIDLMAGVDVPGSGAKSTPYGCGRQWILRGTLVNNIKRILKVCGYELGDWPSKDGANYVDFVIPEASVLPGPGGLPELVDYVRTRFGFAARISKPSRVVGFIDLTTKTYE